MRVSHTSKRIVLIEDGPGSRDDLARVLGKEPDMVILDRTSSPREALLETNRLQPELVLVELADHGSRRLALIRRIRAVNKSAKVIAFSSRGQPIYAARALRCGADGYVVKRRDDPEEIIDATRDVLAGHLYVSEEAVASEGVSSEHGQKRGRGRSRMA